MVGGFCHKLHNFTTFSRYRAGGDMIYCVSRLARVTFNRAGLLGRPYHPCPGAAAGFTPLTPVAA